MESKPLISPAEPLIPPHRCYVEISLSQLADNYRSIASTLPPGALMMPVVKANAYGHGAVPISHKLLECGARWLAVSSTDEAVELRESGIAPPVRIVVMAGILPFEWSAVLEHSLTPVLHTLREVHTLEQLAASANLKVPFHFKLDTGLGRLGSIDSAFQIASVFKTLRHAVPEGLMTHFASAANTKSTQTAEQIQQFERITSGFAEQGITIPMLHMDSTNSLHYPRKGPAVQLVRPGHALYGYVTEFPSTEISGALSVRPILSWKARVLLVKHVPEGATVGYGALHRTTRPTTIAVMGIGYADGYPHRLSNIGRVLIRGHAVPLLGAISMDLTTIDVTDVPLLKVGEAATLIGSSGDHTIDAIDLGRMAGTISYAVLTNIHGRVKRIYIP